MRLIVIPMDFDHPKQINCLETTIPAAFGSHRGAIFHQFHSRAMALGSKCSTPHWPVQSQIVHIHTWFKPSICEYMNIWYIYTYIHIILYIYIHVMHYMYVCIYIYISIYIYYYTYIYIYYYYFLLLLLLYYVLFYVILLHYIILCYIKLYNI